MYFPLLRGKQFELLALREFVTRTLEVSSTSPIIEPVKLDTRILTKAIHTLIEKNVNFNIVINTNIIKSEAEKSIESFCDLIDSHLCKHLNYQIAINVNNENDLLFIWNFISSKKFHQNNFTLIHNEQLDNIELINKFTKEYRVKYNILNTKKVGKRYHRNFDPNSLILLDDPFKQQKRNADYLINIDEFYSDDYLYYKQEGYTGLADFLTIGDQYSDSGFTPYAVAIHLTYLKHEKIRIAHFVSDSDNDTNSPFDIPKKYSEAVNKLITFASTNSLETFAVKEFIRLKDHYPGLGTVKKLSIMNHLELMHSLIK